MKIEQSFFPTKDDAGPARFRIPLPTHLTNINPSDEYHKLHNSAEALSHTNAELETPS